MTPERAQLIVDELDGKLSKNKVMQPISYFRRLLELDQQQPGGLVFEVAHDVARTRIARQAQQDRQHAMLNQTTLAPRGSPAPVQSSASDSAAKAAAIKQLAELRKQIVSKDRSPSPQSGQTASATGASVVGAQALPARARLAMGLRLSKTTI